MRKIVLKQTCIEIHDYNLGDNNTLENNFMIWNPSTYSKTIMGMKYDEENKILYLPRGIDIWYLEKMFNCRATIDGNYFPYEKLGDVKLKYTPRDDVQKEAIAFLTGNGKYKINRVKSQLGLYLNTGKGKTFSSIATICYYGLKSIIITYAKEWLVQWKSFFLTYTNMKDSDVCIIEGSSSINKLMKYGSDKHKVFLISHSSIKRYGDDKGWDKLNEFVKSLKVGLCIFDEAHLNFDNMMNFSFHTNIWKTFYVTATPARSDDRENEIYALSFKNVPAIELFDEEEDPHTDYIALLYNSKPTALEISECRNSYGLDRNKYTNYLVTKPNYYKLLTVLLDISKNTDGKSLYYIGTNSAIMDTKRWIDTYIPELSDDIGVFTSITPKQIKRQQLDKKIILSTTKSCGAAVDIKGLKMTIVLNEPFKSPVLARQTLGRTRDDNTKYLDVVDTGFKQILKYYKSKMNIFDKYAKSMSEIYLMDSSLDARLEKIISKIKDKDSAFIQLGDEIYTMVPRDDENITNEIYGQVDIM